MMDRGKSERIVMDRKLITFLIPVYNEEENIRPLYEKVTEITTSLGDLYDFELLFTDNHSEDSSFRILSELAAADDRVRIFRFSRNFGFQPSIYTGYCKARGDAVIQLDCDLQDPPELIPEFIREWRSGYHVVYGIRRERKESWFLNGARKTFYRVINMLSEDELPLDAGDFRLVDRSVVDVLVEMEDARPYLRGTIASIGFRQTGIPYTRALRERGESKFSFSELLALALDGILNHSVIPLRVATYSGLFISVITVAGVLFYLYARIFLGVDWPPGFATTTALILLSISLNALFLGVIGEYLGRIYRQVRKRPVTIIESFIDPAAGNSRQGRGPGLDGP
ncbi:MAG: glycosyltransferase family 2 protein [bacterium]|nr:glycosyltransferase family 2 protein [bacterium]